MNKKVIGISINGVLRDFFSKIEKTHTKYFTPEEGCEIKILDYDLEKWITFPEPEDYSNEITFNPNFNETSFVENQESFEINQVKPEKVTIEDFLYHKCCLEIFGYADETEDGIVQTLNNFILENKNHDFVIVSKEIGRSIPATLFFLSKTGCMVNNIKFILGDSDCWDFVDCMVTDNPKILESKPSNKHTIKVIKDFNENIISDFTVSSIRELPELLFFK
jgi:hypothetical protein